MKTILIYTSPAKGHLYPMMDIALELKRIGLQVIVKTLAEEKKRVEKEDLIHSSISPKIESIELQDYKGSNPIEQIKLTFACWLKRAPYEIQDLNDAMSEFNPDFLIIDVNTWGAATFAESLNKPWAMFMPYCLPLSSHDTPAFGPGFNPPKNFIHRLRDRFFQWLINNSVKDSIRGLNELRTNLEVDILEDYEDLFSKPDLILYRTAEPFDYSRSEWPENILQLGPGSWAPPAEVPGWFYEMPSPRILISISTEYQGDGSIIETAIEAFADENISVIITTSSLEPDDFYVKTDNIKLTRFLPHAEIIQDIDMLITHGGMGTTQRALSNGVPVCVIPWGRDQNETANRVVLCEAGVKIDRKKLSPEILKKSVKEAFKKKDGAERISKAFKNLNGTKIATDNILKLLQKPVSQT